MIGRTAASLLTICMLAGPAAAATDVGLAAHKAIYKLSLSSKQPRKGTQTVRGRIFYDFSGSACQGYTLKFRQISDIQSDGKSVVNDLRASSWEDGDAKGYKFSSENLTDEKITESAEGKAERGAKAVDVQLNKPKRKALNLPGGVVFPSEQIKRVVEAARAGNVAISNALGAGAVETTAILAFLPALSRHLLKEELRIPNVATCGAGRKANATTRCGP